MQRVTDGFLGRALLARQGLLERIEGDLVEAVEAVGAMQAQYWPAPPVGLWSRVAGFAPAHLHAALERRDLVVGTFPRGTLHLVSAREHPAYAAALDPQAAAWRRTGSPVGPGERALRAAILAHAATVPRTPAQLADFIDAWVARHDSGLAPEEIEAQRALRWRPLLRWGALVRAPADGRWGAKTPGARLAAPRPPEPDAAAALREVAMRHLRAFGPAAAEDVAGWSGARVPGVRRILEAAEGLERFTDEAGRTLYDLPEAPRPGDGAAAPVRLLPAFDSALLAHAPRHRGRILPERHRCAVYEPGNLKLHATFLVNGLVAGTWTAATRRQEATLTLHPLQALPKAARAAVAEEGERMLAATRPEARAHAVVFAQEGLAKRLAEPGR